MLLRINMLDKKSNITMIDNEFSLGLFKRNRA